MTEAELQMFWLTALHFRQKALWGLKEGAKWARKGCGTSAPAVRTLSGLVCVSFHLAQSKDMFIPVLSSRTKKLLSQKVQTLRRMQNISLKFLLLRLVLSNVMLVLVT